MLARDLQLTTPGPREYLADASQEPPAQGPPAYFQAPGFSWRSLAPGHWEYLASASQGLPGTPGPQEYLARASQGPPVYSQAPGVPS